MAIDTSVWTNMDGFEDLFTAPNDPTGGIWGVTIFGLTYLVLFVTLTIAGQRAGSVQPEKEAFLASSVIMAPLSYYMGVLGILGAATGYITILPTLLSVVGIIILARKNS